MGIEISQIQLDEFSQCENTKVISTLCVYTSNALLIHAYGCVFSVSVVIVMRPSTSVPDNNKTTF